MSTSPSRDVVDRPSATALANTAISEPDLAKAAGSGDHVAPGWIRDDGLLHLGDVTWGRPQLLQPFQGLGIGLGANDFHGDYIRHPRIFRNVDTLLAYQAVAL
jgi:hypothetical protein